MKMVLAIGVMSIALILAWYFVAKLIQFDVDLVNHPEEKKLLSINDMVSNPGLAKFFKIFMLADLALFVISIELVRATGVPLDHPLCMIFGLLFMMSILFLGLRQFPYTVTNFRKNGFIPVFCSLVGIVIPVAFICCLLFY